jgi:anaerobic magnesium-protoporphyrin IX monomethyl ester cyclase
VHCLRNKKLRRGNHTLKVFLINPPSYNNISVTRQGRCSCDAIPHVRVEFPIFLAYIASILRQAGHSVAVVDALAENLSLGSIRDRIARFAPDIVIAETVPMTFQGDLLIADTAKQIDKDIHTVFYGWHATAQPTAVLSHNSIDMVLRGEAEYTSLELVNSLENGGDLREVKGLSFKRNNVVEHNPSRPFIKDLDQLPIPARDLFPTEKYVAEPLGKITAVVASKGCPFSCVFCLTHLMNGALFRSRSPSKVADEIEGIVNGFDVKTIFFIQIHSLFGAKRT